MKTDRRNASNVRFWIIPAVGRARWLVAAMGLCAAVTTHAQTDPAGYEGTPVGPEASITTASDYAMDVWPLPSNIEIRRHVVGASADGTASAAGATLVYSNTLGSFVFGLSSIVAGHPFADDITTTVEAGCPLDRYEFLVSGDRTGDGTGVGPFSVDFGLFYSCPWSGGEPVPGTQGHADLPDAGFHMISFQVPVGTDVPLPSTFWLQLKFSREGCGIVTGAPASVGFSADRFDYPGFPCIAFHGGYPGDILQHFPHASFYLEVYVRRECANAFPGYVNRNKGGNYFSRGSSVLLADDLRLAVDGCDMTAYVVGFKGEGRIDLRLKTALSDEDPWAGGTIPGTETRHFAIGDDPQFIRLEVDPPIAIPRDLWVVFRPSASRLGPIITDRLAALGETANSYSYYDAISGRWIDAQVANGWKYSAFDVTIECAGQPPGGACCDTINLDEVGEAVCREIPEMNCPENRWLEGSACDPDPFTPACGLAACCTPEDFCENLTRPECLSLAAPDETILWWRERFCEDSDLYCPFFACVNRGHGSSCIVPSDGPGCANPFCCTDVCELDSWCCEVAWDEVCIRLTDELCSSRPENDECSTAFEIMVHDYIVIAAKGATESETDPGLCCHEGYACPDGICDIPDEELRGVCDGGARDGKSCSTPQRDPDLALTGPGSPGYGTVWFTFEATDSSARVHTCNSQQSGGDSVLQVFRSTDNSTPESACSTLEVIGCSDDASRCGNGIQSSICVTGLVEGETYYVMLAAKTPEDRGLFRLDIESPCTLAAAGRSNDFCQEAQPIQLGETAFDLAGATFQCPVENCAGDALINDLWYEWTAPADGLCEISTCDANQPASAQPDTTMIVYSGDSCPPDSENIQGCSLNIGGDCGASSSVDVLVREGQRLRIRLGGHLGGEPTGMITITCKDGCPPGPIDWIDPPSGVIDARQPSVSTSLPETSGIDSLKIRPPALSDFGSPACIARWTLCETLVEDFPNEVTGVVDNLDGTYTVKLARPISAGAITKLTYTDTDDTEHSAIFTLHPADVDANGQSNAADILAIVDILNGTKSAPWGIYSCDIDHSGTCNAPDILREINLLNGVVDGVNWFGRDRPDCAACCP